MKKIIVMLFSVALALCSMGLVACDEEVAVVGPCVHDYQEQVIVDATCESMGVSARVCTKCGSKQDEFYTQALGHDCYSWDYYGQYSNYENVRIESAVCRRCGELKTRTICPIVYLDDYSVENPNPTEYVVGEGEIELQPLERIGYIFDGWTHQYYDEEFITTVPTNQFPCIVVRAQWTAIDYNLTIECGEEVTVNGAGTYIMNDTVTVTAVQPEDRIFKGWYEGDILVSEELTYVFSMPARDLTLTAVFDNVAITSIQVVDLGEIGYNATLDSLEIPSTVSARTELGEEIQLDVVWNLDSFTSTVLGSQLFEGSLTIPSNNYLADGVSAVLKLSIVPSEDMPEMIITSISNIDLGNINYGTLYADLGLPTVVTATLSDETTVELAVIWNETDYDFTLLGEQTVSGIVFLPNGYTLECEAEVSANLVVVESVIVSFDIIDLGRLPIYTSFNSLGLPATIGANTANGDKFYFNVDWDEYSYDSSCYGEYTIPGYVVVPEHFVLDGELEAITNATVTVSEEMKGIVDIVFVVDTTGSMSNEIANVKNNIQTFAQKLDELGINVRWALMEYRDITCDGMDSTNLHMYLSSNWYLDVENYKQAIAGLRVNGGGDAPETVIDALEMSRNLDMRDSADKFFIVVTDAGFKVENRFDIYSMDEMINRLNWNSVITSVVTSRSYFNEYRNLTNGTGGILCDINSNFADELLNLVQLIDDVVEGRILESIEIEKQPDKVEYRSGEYFNGAGMVVIANYINGERREISAGYTVNPNGVLSVYDTSIEISYRGYATYVYINVMSQDIPVYGVDIIEESKEIYEGDIVNLTCNVYPYDASYDKLLWVSENLNVATVSNGRVVGIGYGTTKIWAYSADGLYRDYCEVTVNMTTNITSVDLNKTALTMAQGDQERLFFVTYPLNVDYRMATWTSSNTNVVSVNDGVVTAISGGEATVTLTIDGSVVANCQVTVEGISNNYSISGRIYQADSDNSDLTNNTLLSGVTVTLTGNQTYTFYTNSYGVYSGTVAEGSYILTASLDGYKTATLNVTVSMDGELSYILLVSNVAATGSVSGYAINASTGYAISGISVYVRTGLGNTTGSYLNKLTTSSSGSYSLSGYDTGSYTLTFVDERSLSSESDRFMTTSISVTVVGNSTITNQNANMVVTLDGDTAVAVLRWGSTPRDLDFHLYIYNKSTGSLVNHISYSNENGSGANLDVDDTSSYGPETIRINVNSNYEYKFVVHNWSGGGSSVLSNSGATVSFVYGSYSQTFNVPSGSGLDWTVLTFSTTGINVNNTIA